MHLRTRTWFIISLLCFLAAAIFWQLAERKAARDKAARESAARESAAREIAAGQTNAPATPAPQPNPPRQPAPAPPSPGPAAAAARTNAANNATNGSLRYRLSNTAKSVDQLSRSDQAILLRNALIDSSLPVDLA